MKILISGASGFLGSHLSNFLKLKGHHIFHLVRRNERSQNDIYWDPYHRNINPLSLEGVDVVIHLSGENVSTSLWTSGKKYRIFKSRIKTTRFLVKSIVKLKQKPNSSCISSGGLLLNYFFYILFLYFLKKSIKDVKIYPLIFESKNKMTI